MWGKLWMQYLVIIYWHGMGMSKEWRQTGWWRDYMIVSKVVEEGG